MSKVRKLLDKIDGRMLRLGGKIAAKTYNKNAKLTRSEILAMCEELESIVRTDVVALRAEAGLPVAADKGRG